MPSTLNNLPVIKYVDEISVLYCAETMRNGDGGAAFRGGVEGVLDDAFGGRVEC